MNTRSKWSRRLVIAGLVVMVAGAFDPLEGAVVIWPASALIVSGEMLTESRHRGALYWSFILITAGVAALLVLSAIGGIGGTTGRSGWWALVLIPYPIGWLSALIHGVRKLREEGHARVMASRDRSPV